MSQYKLDYLVSNGDIDLVFNQFELKSVNPKRQNQSFEYGYFVESLVEAYRENLKNSFKRVRANLIQNKQKICG